MKARKHTQAIVLSNDDLPRYGHYVMVPPGDVPPPMRYPIPQAPAVSITPVPAPVPSAPDVAGKHTS